MLQLLRRFLILLALFFVSGFSLVAHTSAAPMGSHDMRVTNNATSNSTCATICANNIFLKKESILISAEDTNKEPLPHAYSTTSPAIFAQSDILNKLYYAKVQPPPKIPIYIRYNVIRV